MRLQLNSDRPKQNSVTIIDCRFYLDRYGSTSFTGPYGTYLYTEYPACPANINFYGDLLEIWSLIVIPRGKEMLSHMPSSCPKQMRRSSGLMPNFFMLKTKMRFQ